LLVVRIPEHRRRQTVYRTPVITRSGSAKWQAVLEEVLTEHGLGRPVLVGVRSVNASEVLADSLRKAGCTVRVLNALTHAQEAEIIRQAGQAGTITIATNMAGRGTDIRLGHGVAERGGLHVIVAEINESVRVDRQLAGRCGRQGDPGSVSIYLSLDDELAVRLLPDSLRSLLSVLVGRSVRGLSLAAQRAFRWAQARVEAEAFARRWSVLKADEWMRSALPFEGQGRRTS
jgi:preprotein translocase subunit SecA